MKKIVAWLIPLAALAGILGFLFGDGVLTRSEPNLETSAPTAFVDDVPSSSPSPPSIDPPAWSASPSVFKTSTKETDATPYPQMTLLSELDPITEAGVWDDDVVTVRGTAFPDSLTAAKSVGRSNAEASFPLNGRFTSLTGQVGVVDGARSEARFRLEITADGTELYSRDLSVGDLEPVSLDLSDAQTLTIRVTQLEKYEYGHVGLLSFELS